VVRSDVIVDRPADLQAALNVVAEDPDALVVAGGTDVMVAVNYRRVEPDHIVSLDRVEELRDWCFDDDAVRIGAGVTFQRVQETALGTAIEGLRQAARTVGSPSIRAAGTIGGNIGTASPAGDALPILSALDAEVDMVSIDYERSVPIDRFILGPKRTALRPGELIRQIRVPFTVARHEFLKVGARNAMVISVASVAVVVDRERRSVRCALGSVGPKCVRARKAESFASSEIDWGAEGPVPWNLARSFGELAAEAASPIDDHRSTASYRRTAVSVCAARGLVRGTTWTISTQL
jgi:CO/xanthine dehydrogenase FAD-binding subunit